MWFWNKKKKKNNKKTTFDFTELNQTDFSPHNFMHFSIGDEPQQNNTTFGSGDFGGAGASGSWDNDSSDSSSGSWDNDSSDSSSGSWDNDSSDSSSDSDGDFGIGDFGDDD